MSGKEYSFLKTKLADLLISEITPVGNEIKRLLNDKAHLEQILEKRQKKAILLLRKTLKIYVKK